MTAPGCAAPLVVLDTNVVLDWLLFRNTEGADLHRSILTGRVHWIATPAMRAEFAHVLARGRLDAWQPDLAVLWGHWSRHCRERAAQAQGALRARLRCSDADDQKFIDLAVACGARWLVSRDRAVLKLARVLREAGVETTTPGAWRQ